MKTEQFNRLQKRLRRKAGSAIVAALSISGPTARVTKTRVSRELRPKVCQAALNISRQLGYREGAP